MIKHILTLAACSVVWLAAGTVSAQTTINFNGSKTPEGTVVLGQFSPQAFFFASPMAGLSDAGFYGSTGANLGTWATNTDMTVTGTDVGAENAGLAGMRQLHAFGNTYTTAGWLSEDGDPSFLIDFPSAISMISVTFAGDSSGSSGIADFTGGVISNVVHVPVGSNTALETVTLTGLRSNNILVVPGSYGDWASVVSISFSAVPEPSTWAMLIGGALVLGTVAIRRRRA